VLPQKSKTRKHERKQINQDPSSETERYLIERKRERKERKRKKEERKKRKVKGRKII